MDKKLTTTLGIALGASLIAGAGFGIYKFIKNKRKNDPADNLTSGIVSHNSTAGSKGFPGGFIGNSLVKSKNLYGSHLDNGLVGSGLTKVMDGYHI